MVFLVLVWLCLFGTLAQSRAEPPAELYQAEVIVTGLEEAERLRGFREAFEEILSKLTLQAGVANSVLAQDLRDNAKYYVARFCYEDRNRHLKVNDEQGTRDRPHFLTVVADRPRLDAAIASAGLLPWLKRPVIQILLTVKTAQQTFLLADEDSATAGQELYHDRQKTLRIASTKYDGLEQRDTLKRIGLRRGLPIVLPIAARIAGQASEPYGAEAFQRPAFGEGTLRYEAALEFIGDGVWHLKATAFKATPQGERRPCFSFEDKTTSFAAPLETSLVALAEQLKSGKTSCIAD